ncbi:phage holin [Bacillus sp. AG4(2022)]|uniref:phage holin n=1 Tax=Bacillus sp. AG4(2022) TaxID=2962594 RepID=UPI0028817291|nr:phage holin [Bacillus sp. AG4(2022)]MDT0160247.1 phage holin [Bacillus sp. AG4(2022)]
MKINWKVRIKNPVFLVQIGLAFFAPILGYFGLTAQDITTWDSLLKLITDALANPYVVGIIAVSVWNALNDPTTKALSDSEAALNYKKPE